MTDDAAEFYRVLAELLARTGIKPGELRVDRCEAKPAADEDCSRQERPSLRETLRMRHLERLRWEAMCRERAASKAHACFTCGGSGKLPPWIETRIGRRWTSDAPCPDCKGSGLMADYPVDDTQNRAADPQATAIGIVERQIAWQGYCASGGKLPYDERAIAVDHEAKAEV